MLPLRSPHRSRGLVLRAPRLAAPALLAALLTLPAPSSAAPVEVTWDPELAADHDRRHYARALQELVEESLELASSGLGLRRAAPLRVVVLTTPAYESRFGTEAAFSEGACYAGGALYVNGASRFGDRLTGVVVHGMAHAVLDHRGTSNLLPMWLNEGLAERLAWRRRGLDDLAPNQRTGLKARSRELVPLPTWGTAVPFTHLQCYAAALFLERRLGWSGVLEIVRRTLDGEAFERALDEVARLTPAELERGFVEWVEHL